MSDHMPSMFRFACKRCGKTDKKSVIVKHYQRKFLCGDPADPTLPTQQQCLDELNTPAEAAAHAHVCKHCAAVFTTR